MAKGNVKTAQFNDWRRIFLLHGIFLILSQLLPVIDNLGSGFDVRDELGQLCPEPMDLINMEEVECFRLLWQPSHPNIH